MQPADRAAAQLVDDVFNPFLLHEKILRFLRDMLGFAGWYQTAPFPNEQRKPDQILGMANHVADRRLADIQQVRRPRGGAYFDDGAEHF